MTAPNYIVSAVPTEHIPFIVVFAAFLATWFILFARQIDRSHERRVEAAEKRRRRRKTRDRSPPKRIYNLRSSASPRLDATPPPLDDFSSSEDAEEEEPAGRSFGMDQTDSPAVDEPSAEESRFNHTFDAEKEMRVDVLRLTVLLENGLVFPISPLQMRQMITAYELILPHMPLPRPSLRTIIATLAEKLNFCPKIEFSLPKRKAIRTSPYQAPLYTNNVKEIEELFDKYAASHFVGCDE